MSGAEVEVGKDGGGRFLIARFTAGLRGASGALAKVGRSEGASVDVVEYGVGIGIGVVDMRGVGTAVGAVEKLLLAGG